MSTKNVLIMFCCNSMNYPGPIVTQRHRSSHFYNWSK